MKSRALAAHLAHVAQRQHARGGHARQHVNERQHGIGVGVVGVVNQRDSAACHVQQRRARAARHGAKGCQPCRHRLNRRTRRHGAGQRGQRVEQVVAACGVQAESHFAHGRDGAGAPAFALPERLAREHARACGLLSKCEQAVRPRKRGPQLFMGIARRKNGRAACLQAAKDTAVFPRHGLHARHEFLVLALRVVHQRHGRRGHAGQHGDFAGVVHAQLHHGHAVCGAQAQQGQRHAHVVVQVALRGQRGAAVPGAEDGGQHLRDSGFAVAARHGHQRPGKAAAAPASGHLPQRAAGIGRGQAGQAAGLQLRPAGGIHQRAGRAFARGFGQEVGGVEALAAQRHEQVARRERARVGVHAGHGRGRIACQLPAFHPLRHFAQRQAHALRRRVVARGWFAIALIAGSPRI